MTARCRQYHATRFTYNKDFAIEISWPTYEYRKRNEAVSATAGSLVQCGYWKPRSWRPDLPMHIVYYVRCMADRRLWPAGGSNPVPFQVGIAALVPIYSTVTTDCIVSHRITGASGPTVLVCMASHLVILGLRRRTDREGCSETRGGPDDRLLVTVVGSLPDMTNELPTYVPTEWFNLVDSVEDSEVVQTPRYSLVLLATLSPFS